MLVSSSKNYLKFFWGVVLDSIMRYLLGWELDVEEAIKRLKATLAWRKENDIDSLLERRPPRKYELLQRTFKIHKTDREGNPVFYWNNGYFYSSASLGFCETRVTAK